MATCPKHGTQLQPSKFGVNQFFCPSTDPDTKNGRCSYKATIAPQTPAQPQSPQPAPPVSGQPISQPSQDLVPLAAAALEMAGRFYGHGGFGNGPEAQSGAISLAQRAFAAMAAMVKQ